MTDKASGIAAMWTAGGGFVLLTAVSGQILSPAHQYLVRMTVTGMDGQTTYVYLLNEHREALIAALEAAWKTVDV